MAADNVNAKYYVLESANPNQMLLYDVEEPSDEDNWLLGQPFQSPPEEPVVAEIQPGYERKELMPYFGTPPIMSDDFHQALVDAGVDNLEVYDAVLRSEDGSIEHTGFKAFNVVGLVSAADLSRTKFSPDNPSRLIDAGIESLAVDADKAKDLLLFRLAEYVGAVVVHEKVKRAIESRNFPHVVFQDPSEFISL
jgi:hypothetical protein